jgi:hypothetical protein
LMPLLVFFSRTGFLKRKLDPNNLNLLPKGEF